MEQYANDRGTGQDVRGGQSPPEAETAFGRLMEAANLPAFQYRDTKNHCICSLHDP